MQSITSWLWSLFVGVQPNERPEDDRRQFSQREADARRRLANLEHEADVMQRVETREEPRS
jgi:hypothetical protein